MTKISTLMVVVAGGLVRPDGLILMHKRRLGGVHGGLWEFPGGKVEPGESPGAALMRELDEELGIKIRVEDAIPVGFAPHDLVREPGHPAIVILLYACRKWQGVPECLEGEQIGWFSGTQMAGLDMPPLDIPLAKQLLDQLAAGLI